MTLQSIQCPKCGAPVYLSPGEREVTCVYCKSSLMVSADTRVEVVVPPTEESKPSLGISFRMVIEDVFSIRERGTVVTGCVESGTLKTGDVVTIWRGNSSRTAKVGGIEMFHKILDSASSGDHVGVLLKDVGKNDVKQGDVLTLG